MARADEAGVDPEPGIGGLGPGAPSYPEQLVFGGMFWTAGITIL